MSYQQQLAKGEAACLRFDALAIEKGYATAKPTVDTGYDRILDTGDRLYRVQIKSTNVTATARVKGSVYVDLRRSHKHKDFRYTREVIDALVVYVKPIDSFCWFGPEVFEVKTYLTIRYEPTRNSQKEGCVFIEDYLWE